MTTIPYTGHGVSSSRQPVLALADRQHAARTPQTVTECRGPPSRQHQRGFSAPAPPWSVPLRSCYSTPSTAPPPAQTSRWSPRHQSAAGTAGAAARRSRRASRVERSMLGSALARWEGRRGRGAPATRNPLAPHAAGATLHAVPLLHHAQRHVHTPCNNRHPPFRGAGWRPRSCRLAAAAGAAAGRPLACTVWGHGVALGRHHPAPALILVRFTCAWGPQGTAKAAH